MNKRRVIQVHLPGQPDPIVLPQTLALALRLIINAGREGINTPSLQSWGVYGVHNTIYRLRKHGVGIKTKLADMHDQDGNIRKGVGYYSYDSALTPTPKTEVLVNRLASTRPSVFGRILSKLKGTI